MKLTQKEKKIVEIFKSKIEQKYPGRISDVIVYGSKARGDATENSDIDVLVTILDYNWRLGDEIRAIGYELDEEIGYSLSIQVLSKEHVDYLKNKNFQFIRNVESYGMTI